MGNPLETLGPSQEDSAEYHGASITECRSPSRKVLDYPLECAVIGPAMEAGPSDVYDRAFRRLRAECFKNPILRAAFGVIAGFRAKGTKYGVQTVIEAVGLEHENAGELASIDEQGFGFEELSLIHI